MPSSHDPKVLEKEHVFPPRGGAVLSANGEICMPKVTYGDWRKYVSPEKWAVANMTFYVNPYWPTWSVSEPGAEWARMLWIWLSSMHPTKPARLTISAMTLLDI